MKQKILNVTAFILVFGSILYIYGIAGSLELSMITVGQAFFRCTIGFIVMMGGVLLTKSREEA